ncbi:MAG: hypothetical protein ACOH2H_06955 [Cypionkella sp.]
MAVKAGACRGYVTGQAEAPALEFDPVNKAFGPPYAFNQALEAVERQGPPSILSHIQPTAKAINPRRLMLKEISFAGWFQFSVEFHRALGPITSGKQIFDQLIIVRCGLQDVRAALELMLTGRCWPAISSSNHRGDGCGTHFDSSIHCRGPVWHRYQFLHESGQNSEANGTSPFRASAAKQA